MFFRRAASWVSVWRAALGHVVSAYSRTMIGGVCAVVKGDFHEYVVGRRAGGIPAYAGMTGVGTGMGERKGARTL